MKKLLKFSVLTIGLLLAIGFVSCNQGNNSDSAPDTVDVTITPGDDDTGAGDEERIANGTVGDAIATVEAVKGVTNVFSAEFDGDYFLSGAIDADLITSADLISYLQNNMPGWKTVTDDTSTFKINVQGAACSSIVAKNKTEGASGYIYGRNFDWDKGPALILHTYPLDGYESVSTCYLPFADPTCGEPDWTFKPADKYTAISCVYIPMDGMNEKGLYIANLQNDTDPVMPEEGDETKTYVQTTVAIRYILDKCATVDEAIAWLKTITMCPVYGDVVDESGNLLFTDYHFAIADNTGKSVVVEWINGELKTVDSKIVTNHSLVNDLPDFDTLPENLDRGTYNRYDSLEATGKAKNWEMTSEEIAEALSDVQQWNSVWSAVFEPSAKRVTYYFRKADPQAGVDQTDPDAVHNAKHHPIDYATPVVVQF